MSFLEARCLRRSAPLLVLLLSHWVRAQAPPNPHTLHYSPSHSITLSLPASFDIHVAAAGLQRVRFLAQSPDGRIFATGMHNLADNTQGSIFILDGWDPQTYKFTRITHYLDHLRNPNNLAFYTDPSTRQTWLYVPLTDRLVRYRYNAGDNTPASPPEILTHWPDYGLNYKYGGWHLTRTVAVAALHGRTRIYIAAGSSCDYCREREVIRASLSAMDPDGSHYQLLAHGLRNAVDLRFVPNLDGGALFASNMGDDHLGDKLPEDTFFELDSDDHPGPIFRVHQAAPVPPGTNPLTVNDLTIPPPNYGWPTCYFANGRATLDTTPLPKTPGPTDRRAIADRPPPSPGAPGPDSRTRAATTAPAGTLLPAGGGNTAAADPNANLGQVPAPLTSCSNVPAAYTTFAAHSSPLGLAYFGSDNAILRDTFLVALHGAGHPHIGTGYRLVRFTPEDRTPVDFLTGFLSFDHGKPVVHGRPCGMLRLGPDTFLLTDDHLGLIYYVHPRA